MAVAYLRVCHKTKLTRVPLNCADRNWGHRGRQFSDSVCRSAQVRCEHSPIPFEVLAAYSTCRIYLSQSFIRNTNQFRTEEQAKAYIALGIQAESEGINALKGRSSLNPKN